MEPLVRTATEEEAPQTLPGGESAGSLARTLAAGTLLAGLCIAWLLRLGGAMLTLPDVQETVLLLGLVALAPLIGLRRRPILLIYCFVMIAGGVSQHVTLYLNDVPAVTYFAKTEGRLSALRELLPTWFVPRDARVVAGLYEGSSDGSVPWAAWLVPALHWLVFLLLFWGTLLCIVALFERQWVEKERLSFPIIFLPLHLTEEDRHGRLALDMLRRPAMWIGAGLSFAHFGMMIAHAYAPSVPCLESRYDIGQWFTQRPFSAMQPLPFAIRPDVVALGYFVPQDLCFSFFFCYLLMKAAAVLYAVLGYEAGGAYSPRILEQQSGAYLALFLCYLYAARGHLREIGRRVLGGDGPRGGEPVAPRWAVAGLVAGAAGLIAWSAAAGMAVWVAVLFWGIILMFAFVFTRGRAEGGMATFYVYPYAQAARQPVNWLGASPFAPLGNAHNLTLIASLLPFHYGVFPFLMTYQLETLKIGEAARIRRSHLLAVILAACLTGLVLAFALTLWHHYGEGPSGYTQSVQWRQNLALAEFRRAATQSADPPLPDRVGNMYAIAGFCITLVLFVARITWVGFPIHPLGYAFTAYYGIVLWGPFFVVWLAKALIFRYGGMRLYRGLIPFFVGLLVGEVVALGIVMPLMAALTGTPMLTRPVYA